MFEEFMQRTFVQTSEFTKQWSALGLDDDDLRKLELMLLQNPEIGPVLQGTGGLRKMRFALENRGKSGSVRVCYVDFVLAEIIYLITCYPKNKKDNLTAGEKNVVRKVIEALEKELRKGDCHE